MRRLLLHRLFLLLLPAVTFAGCTADRGPTAAAGEMLEASCAYLWSQQAEDGGWHSATHGLLRGGQAWTPFILSALLEAPEAHCPADPRAVYRARRFIVLHLNEEGALGLADPDVMEYPNYATAYALRALALAAHADDGPAMERMKAYLLGQQFIEHRGIEMDHPAYGGWGFGERYLAQGTTGHTDLSHTRRVLEALRLAAVDRPEIYQKARYFLQMLQKDGADPRLSKAGMGPEIADGGFFSSAVTPEVNKSIPEVSVGAYRLYGSYASATCDGILALLAAGAPAEDPAVRGAAAWLRAHPDLTYPEGVRMDTPEQWHRVLYYYHLSGRAEVYARLGWEGDWRGAMVEALAGKQAGDGSFANPEGALNKENDPLLATAMAVQALGHILTPAAPALP